MIWEASRTVYILIGDEPEDILKNKKNIHLGQKLANFFYGGHIVSICNFVSHKVFIKSTQLYSCSVTATIDCTLVSKWGCIPIKL